MTQRSTSFQPAENTQNTNGPGDALICAVMDAQRQRTLLPRPTSRGPSNGPLHIVIGVSGGADSVCLLHLLHQLAPNWGLALHVAHLDHNLRAESAQDAAYVATLARRWSLPFYIEQLAPNALQTHPGGLEDGARQARYRFLGQIARQVTPDTQQPIIAVAHNADDQVETVLMNMVRGSGLAGLAGMKWVSELDGAYAGKGGERVKPSGRWPEDASPTRVGCGHLPEGDHAIRLIRPLLGVTRAAICDDLNAHDIAWREDASNQDTAYLRNRLRHEVMPQLRQINPKLTTAIGRTTDVLAAELERAEQANWVALRTVLCDPPALDAATHGTRERIVFDQAKLHALDMATQRGVLRHAFVHLGGDLRNGGFDAIETLRTASTQCSTSQCSTSHCSTSGRTHPLFGDIAWTLLLATPDCPARLCLHRHDALPIQPKQPFLDRAWRAHHRAAPVEPVQHVSGWQLHSAGYPVTQLPRNWRARTQPWRAFLDAALVAEPMLTTPRAGLRFAPLGMADQHKTLGDLFTDRKIPVALRVGWPIITDRATDQVLWVCGLQLAHDARITGQTEHVRQLWWTHTET